MRKLEVVSIENKEEMRGYLNKYLIELSEYDDTIKFDENGNPLYRYFDDYFVDEDRYPFYFMVDDAIAGIGLVRELDSGYEIAEFYVLKEYRKDDNALLFAKMIFDAFKGDFSFSTRQENKRAIGFWDKVCLGFKGVEMQENKEYKEWKIKR